MPIQSIRGANIHYEDQGKGLPVVLLHGFPVDGRMWLGQIADLTSRYRVIAPDLPGFGKSQGTPQSIEQFAEDVHSLLSGIDALPCVLGGLSMGGYAAFAYFRKYGSDLRGLMLFDTRPDADTPQAREARDKAIALVREKGASGIADQMIPKIMAPGGEQSRPALAGAIREMAEGLSAINIERALVALRDRPDSTATMAQIKIPTLIVVGNADQVTPPDIAQKMHAAIAGSRLEIIGGAGHMSPLEQPGPVNRAMAAFLGKIPLA